MKVSFMFKAFVSWFYYAEEKKRKKVAIKKALERRQQWLQKVTVMQWIKVILFVVSQSMCYKCQLFIICVLFQFATYFIAERERFAASRHIQVSCC